MGYDFDLFVIGGGSGGVRAARVTAALRDKRVGLAEMDRYGGTCVIRGCVPKKLMYLASDARESLSLLEGFGMSSSTTPKVVSFGLHVSLV